MKTPPPNRSFAASSAAVAFSISTIKSSLRLCACSSGVLISGLLLTASAGSVRAAEKNAAPANAAEPPGQESKLVEGLIHADEVMAGEDIEEAAKANLSDKAAKTLGKRSALVAHVLPAAGSYLGGDQNKAFSDLLSTLTGAIASGLLEGLWAPVAGEIVVGFAVKESVGEMIDSYDEYRDMQQVNAMLDGAKANGSYLKQMAWLQDAIEKAKDNGDFDQVAGIAEGQKELVARYKDHREKAKQIAATLEQLAAKIREVDFEASKLAEPEREAEAQKSQSWDAYLKAASAAEVAKQNSQRQTGAARAEAGRKLSVLKAEMEKLRAQSDRDNEAYNAVSRPRWLLTEQAKDWRQRLGEELTRFKAAAAALPLKDAVPPNLETQIVVDAPQRCTEGDKIVIKVMLKNPPGKSALEFSEDGKEWSNLEGEDDVQLGANQAILTPTMSDPGDFTLYIRATDLPNKRTNVQTKLTISVEAKKVAVQSTLPSKPATATKMTIDSELAAAAAEYKAAVAAYQEASKRNPLPAELPEIVARRDQATRRYYDLVSRKASSSSP
jgi:hypothetical protein